MKTLWETADDLEAGRVTAAALVADCLARIEDRDGEGARAFLSVYADEARAAAAYQDQLRARGRAATRFAGCPVSVKDLFDVAGDVTRAGSRVLAGAPSATADAAAVARLRAAGFVLIGRTNMSEFAYSGLGLNPHYGTPRNPWDRRTGRVPGGSSSGAAVSVGDGMAVAGLGTDTGGSCRIPAAFTGLVGFKPTARRVPRDGVTPLSPSLDSVGPIARSVRCCALIDAVLSGEDGGEPTGIPLRGLRLAVPQTLVLEGMDEHVAAAFQAAVDRLSRADAVIRDIPFTELAEIPGINEKGGFTAAESYAWHRRLVEAHAGDYDPRVLARILRGRDQSAADYIERNRARADLIARAAAVMAPFDALALPTVPIVAPALSEVAGDDDFNRINLLVLRNPAIVNLLDGCAISLPCHEPGTPPVGLMLVCGHGADHRLFAIARAVEDALTTSR